MICGTRWRPLNDQIGIWGLPTGWMRAGAAGQRGRPRPPARRDATAGAYFYQPTTDRVSVSSHPDAWPPGRLAASPPPRSHLYTLTLIAHTHTHTRVHTRTHAHMIHTTPPLLFITPFPVHTHHASASGLLFIPSGTWPLHCPGFIFWLGYTLSFTPHETIVPNNRGFCGLWPTGVCLGENVLFFLGALQHRRLGQLGMENSTSLT